MSDHADIIKSILKLIACTRTDYAQTKEHGFTAVDVATLNDRIRNVAETVQSFLRVFPDIDASEKVAIKDATLLLRADFEELLAYTQAKANGGRTL